MAVYTQVGDDELEAFIARYDLGALRSYKGIAEGVENSNYLVRTETGSFILTLYEKRVAPEDLPYFLGLMEHLADHAITCPTPVHDRAGKVLQALAGRPAAMVTFLDGFPPRRPSATHCASLGHALARLHLAGQSFPMRRANSLTLGGWPPLFEAIRDEADTIAAGLAQEIGRELDALAHVWPANLPEGVIHADLFPDNVFFLNDAVSGIIDFYFACNDMLAYDIAVCLNAWCFEPDNAFNVTKARAMLRAYARARPLTGDEFAALPILARGAALRFLLTRAFDWLNAPDGALVRPKDPMEYVRKLRFHQNVDTARDYGFEPFGFD